MCSFVVCIVFGFLLALKILSEIITNHGDLHAFSFHFVLWYSMIEFLRFFVTKMTTTNKPTKAKWKGKYWEILIRNLFFFFDFIVFECRDSSSSIKASKHTDTHTPFIKYASKKRDVFRMTNSKWSLFFKVSLLFHFFESA